jgi:hypothetical protein
VRLPTASRLDLARTCAGSAVLPRVEEVTPGMTLGSVRHLFLQRCNEVGREAALDAVEPQDLRAMMEAIDLEGLPIDPAAYAAEVTFAWSTMSGEARELGRGLQRDYSAAGDDELVGTADTVALLGSDGVFVSDFKGEHDHGVAPPARNLQLRMLGLAAARAYGRERVVLEIIRPREGAAWRERAELDVWGLAEVAEELRELVRDVRRAGLEELRLVVGPHCSRCPSIRHCPAHVALVRELATADAMAERMEDALTPSTAGRAWMRIKAAEAALARIKGSIRAMAERTPIPLEDGRVLGLERRRHESYEPKTLWSVVNARMGEEAAWSAVEISAPKARLKDLARHVAQREGRKISHVEREIVEELAGKGGLIVSHEFELRVHKPKERRI